MAAKKKQPGTFYSRKGLRSRTVPLPADVDKAVGIASALAGQSAVNWAASALEQAARQALAKEGVTWPVVQEEGNS